MMTAMMVTPPMPETLTPTLSLSPPPVPATIEAILTTTLTMPMMVTAAMMVVQQLDRRADHGAMDLGDPLRGRALRSNRAARDFHCNPCRLRALCALRTPFARRLAALTAAPVSCSRSAHRSPWPATPAAGFASARAVAPGAPAGAGFAAHRAAHHARHWCPHECGHFRLRLRQRAAHHCLRLRPQRPPLNRRGGSPPPASPASIPPSLSLGFPALSTPCGVWFSHPTHSKCWICHARACHALSATSAAFGRPALVGPSVCSGEDLLSYWNRVCFSGGRSRSMGLVILLYRSRSRRGAGGGEKGSRQAVPVR